ncbi:APC family permease [Parahaliea mediterranea]|uniref:Amino acid permease n=1 Tax=Parahaliea mediterranea TaxID=651086 RepID=A0A939DEU9_9GAMM|nr:APC family permease [Parahaliea mediterranea]MBN7796849.1 amino acid permease [Parahaliea mediterranea]
MAESPRVIGAPAATFTLVGFVVGASIYTVPAELAAESGAGVLVSFAVAALLALLGCVATIQLASAFPVTGAGYVAVRELLSPFAGAVAAVAVLSASVVAVALLAHGFAAYTASMLPSVADYRLPLAWGLVSILAALNVVGTRAAVAGQVVMSLLFIAALLVFAVAGVAHGLQHPGEALSFSGLGAVVYGVVPAYFSFLGFTLLGELAGDMRRPEKTIPVALLSGFVIILLTYLLVTLALLLAAGPRELAEAGAPLALVASKVAGEGFALVIGASALLAAATSINGVLMMVSRDVLLLARDGVLPAGLSRTTQGGGGIPYAAVVSIWLLSLLCIAFESSIQGYAIATVMGFMVFQALAALAVARLPFAAPGIYRSARLRFPPRVLLGAGSALMVVSAVMLVLGALSAPVEAGLYAMVLALLVGLCALGRRRIKAESAANGAATPVANG